MNRLHELLRLRRREEDLADGELASAMRDRAAAQAKHDALTRSDVMVSSVPQARTLPELMAQRMQGVAAQEELETAAEALALRMHDEAQARAARTTAAVRRRSVQRVVERRDAEQHLHALRAARRALAELARLQAAQR